MVLPWLSPLLVPHEAASSGGLGQQREQQPTAAGLFNEHCIAWKQPLAHWRSALPQELRLGDDEVATLPIVGTPGPLETLPITLQSAARSHAALARLATLRTLEMWPYAQEVLPSKADTAALLAALSALPSVCVLWCWRPRQPAMRFLLPSSDPRELVRITRAFAGL